MPDQFKEKRVSMTKIGVYLGKQCDPKKCTAKKLVKFNLAKELTRPLFHSELVLTPTTRRALSPADRERIDRFGIVAIDCSWNKADDFFDKVTISHGRALPYLIAVNPTNFGRPWKLNTAEALAAALYIVGLKKEAEEIMDKFKWGEHFFNVNMSYLEAYADCKDSQAVVDTQEFFVDTLDR